MIPLYALKLLHVVPANFIFNEKQPNKVRICLLGKKGRIRQNYMDSL